MSKLNENVLSDRDEVLVAIAVLLDGHDAEDYLSVMAEKGQSLSDFAKELNSKKPEERLPLVASMLRRAKQSFNKENS